jgi:SnoaL-like domain
MVTVPDAVQRMIDATNREDSDAFVACFTDDAFLSDWGREFHGREGVSRWNQTDNIGVHARFAAKASRREGSEDIVTLTVSGAGYNGTGDIRFTLTGYLINRMIISAD